MSLSESRKKRLAKLLEEYDLLNEKLGELRRAKILETDVAALFKLEKQIERTEEELKQTENEIETIETSSEKLSYEKPSNKQKSKYEVHFHSNAKGVVIGDGAKVDMKSSSN